MAEIKEKYESPELTRIITILDRVPAPELAIAISPDDWIKIYNFLKDLEMYYRLYGKLGKH